MVSERCSTGLNQNTYSFIPANGDQVYVEMTSDLTCVSGSPATSTTTTMVVNASLPAGVASRQIRTISVQEPV